MDVETINIWPYSRAMRNYCVNLRPILAVPFDDRTKSHD